MRGQKLPVQAVEGGLAVRGTGEFLSYPADEWRRGFSSRRRRFRTKEHPPRELSSSARTTHSCVGAASPALTHAFDLQHLELWMIRPGLDRSQCRSSILHSPPLSE